MASSFAVQAAQAEDDGVISQTVAAKFNKGGVRVVDFLEFVAELRENTNRVCPRPGAATTKALPTGRLTGKLTADIQLQNSNAVGNHQHAADLYG